MSNAKYLLLVLLGLTAIVFCTTWARELNRSRAWRRPTRLQTVIGFITDFFDTLGIGSFAVTTALFRWRRVVPDELIPGTLNVGHTIATFAQAFIFITIIEVRFETLALLIGASTLGAWLGAGVVTRLPRRRIQVGLGIALSAAAALLLARVLEIFPPGGDALGLAGTPLVVAVLGNFVFGALMTIGVGAYAPIMIMVSLLGMNPKGAFPIMMGSCAFLMPVAGGRFIRTGRYDAQAALGLTLGGIPAVLLAAFIVKELPLDVVRWLVLVVVLHTAVSMFRAARREHATPGRT
jgi:uncharacterized membrane protein YfcA